MKYFRHPHRKNSPKCHVLATVDGNMIVFKWWGSVKQRWNYEVLHESEIEWM